jgi:hypothetical protein
MAELLLRGTQTEGELRGRAARMEPIADVAALRPVLDSLKAKGLVISLSPAGRGHVLTHALYEPRELEKQKAEFAGGGAAHSAEQHISEHSPAPQAAPAARPPTPMAPPSAASSESQSLRREIAELRNELAELRQAVGELQQELQTRAADFDRLKEALGA